MKKSKNQEIVNAGESKGWKVTLWSVEVGCRGFLAVSLGNYLRDIGFSGAERTKHLKLVGEINVQLRKMEGGSEQNATQTRRMKDGPPLIESRLVHSACNASLKIL